MAQFSGSIRTSVTTATIGTPIFALRGDTSRRMAVHEIGITNITAPTTSGAIGLVRSLTVGTATSPVVLAPHDINETATTAQVEASWSAAPTIAASPVYLRRFAHGTAVGNGFVWTFSQLSPLIVQLGGTAVGGSLIITNLQATVAATYDIYVTAEVL